MRWQKVSLVGEHDAGQRDALNNPITEEAVLGMYKARLTDWEREEVEQLSASYTLSHRRMVTNAPMEIIRAAKSVIVASDRYSVEGFSGDDVDRWRVVHLKGVKL